MEEYFMCRFIDAQFGNIDALMECNLAYQEAYETEKANDIKEEIMELRGEVKALGTKMDVLTAKLDLLLSERAGHI